MILGQISHGQRSSQLLEVYEVVFVIIIYLIGINHYETSNTMLCTKAGTKEKRNFGFLILIKP